MLIEKYKNGFTSVEEEKFLFENTDDLEIQKIRSFAQSQKVEVLKDLNDKLWNDFEKKIARKEPRKIWSLSAVASVVLILSFYLNSKYQNHVNEVKKGELLEEAISLFSEEEEPFQPIRILFEDETLIVYTKTKK